MINFLFNFNKFLTKLNSWRDKWLQSKIKSYLEDFKQRSRNKQEYWFERLFLPLAEQTIINTPNLLSLFRAIMSVPIAIFIIDNRLLEAFIFFSLGMFLDAIDGPLARVLKQETDLGEILDPLGDKLIFASVFLTLGIKYLSSWLFLLTLILELVIVFMALVLRPIAKKKNLIFRKKATLAGKIKLNLQAIGCGLLILNLIKAANIFFIISLPFSLTAIIKHLIIKKPHNV